MQNFVKEAGPKMTSIFKKILSNPFLIVLVTLVITTICYVSVRFFLDKYNTMLSRQDTEPILIKNIREASKDTTIDNKLIPDSDDGSAYTVSVWLYIHEFEQTRQYKHILHKGDGSYNTIQPGIWLLPDTNDILIRFSHTKTTFDFKQNLISNSIGTKLKMKKHAKQVYVDSNLIQKYQNVLDMFNENRIKTGHFTVQEMEEKCINEEDCTGFYGIVNASATGSPNSSQNNIEVAIFPSNSGNNEYTYNRVMPARSADGQSYAGYFDSTNFQPKYPDSSSCDDDCITLKNVPLGRWFHLAVVAKNQTAEVYVDGSLQESKVLPGSVENNNGDLYVTQDGGFKGLLTQLRYFNHDVNHMKIRDIYTCGPECWQWPNLQEKGKEIYNTVKKKAQKVERKFESIYDSASDATDYVIDNVY